jgi:hypothetical protein
MSQVYSTSLIAEKELTGTATYGVPSGYVLVVVAIDVYWGSEVFVPSGRVLGAAGQVFAVWQGAALAANIMQWRGRHVMNAGETLTVSVDNGNADVSVSGYLLSLP